MKRIVYLLLLIPITSQAQAAQSSGSSTFSNILSWAVIIGLGYWWYTSSQKKNARIAEAARLKKEYDDNLEAEYREALLGTNRAKALALGRQYYGNKRGDNALTIYDEQALTNDLSTMQ